ncbi:alpha/beta fold hydrolase [Streptomyces sp. MBT33]|uniref:alpha/beta fold hydrolase n=1 Tax=Streptomyces sp. MBT33 TaxID=1488363 RepID=UPI00190D0FFD|nr:alpha/beta hydrolase [Streptomyces sp. MBT33]MBK3641057.1 alpha/beta hydrolase [Streptomyces sp. MBT33]
MVVRPFACCRGVVGAMVCGVCGRQRRCGCGRCAEEDARAGRVLWRMPGIPAASAPSPGEPSPQVPADIGSWLDSWPVPFPSREAAAQFLGGGPVGEGWAAGLEERDGAWWPRFDRDVMVDSLAENAWRSYWDEWARITCPTLAVLGQSSIIAPEECDRMLQQRPATVAMSLPGAGHDLHLEQPDILLKALQCFLRDTTEPRAVQQT